MCRAAYSIAIRTSLVPLLACVATIACSGPRVVLTPEQGGRARVPQKFVIEDYEYTPTGSDAATGFPLVVIRWAGNDRALAPRESKLEDALGAEIEAGESIDRIHTKSFAIPVAASGDTSVETTLRITGVRKNDTAIDRRFRLRLRKRMVSTDLLEIEDPEPWRQATYPLWGLPRDVLDLPLTFLTRTGMSIERTGWNTLRSSADVLMWTSTLGFATVGIFQGWDHANSHLYEQFFYGGVYGEFFGWIGKGAGLAAVAGIEYVVVPAQTALLRTGVDRTYWKGDATRIDLDPDPAVAYAQLETNRRGTCYFPNWQLVARGKTFERGEPSTAWEIEAITAD